MMPESGFRRSGRDAYKPIFGFFGLQENPFKGGPDLRYLSFTREIHDAFDALANGIQTRQGLMVLTGDVGTGKTILNKYLLNWLHERKEPTAYIVNPRLNPADLFDCIAANFGIVSGPEQEDKKSALAAWLLKNHELGNVPVLIVDEAQALPVSTLEEIRLLLDLGSPQQKLLQVVLVGQPELERMLDRQELRQLNERVAVRCRIGPLSSRETQNFIHQRLHVAGSQDDSVFAPDAIDAVHAYSCGIPRLINLLCEHALLNAYVDEIRPVRSQIVREIATNFQFDQIKPPDTRIDLSEIRSTSAAAIPSVSAIVAIGALETQKSFPAEPQKDLMVPAAVGLVDEKLVLGSNRATTAPAAANAPVETIHWANRVAALRRWMARPVSFETLLSTWRRWGGKHLAAAEFPISLRFSSVMVRWLMQPAVPRHARVRNVQAQIRKDIRKGIERSLRGAKAKLGSRRMVAP